MRGASRPGGKPVLCARTRLVLAGAVGAGAVVVKFDHPGEFNQTDPAVTVGVRGVEGGGGAYHQRVGLSHRLGLGARCLAGDQRDDHLIGSRAGRYTQRVGERDRARRDRGP